MSLAKHFKDGSHMAYTLPRFSCMFCTFYNLQIIDRRCSFLIIDIHIYLSRDLCQLMSHDLGHVILIVTTEGG